MVFFALVFGAAGAGQAGAFAPNYAKAKLSASRIFFLLDREPVIDSYSEDGEEAGKMTEDQLLCNGTICFNWVVTRLLVCLFTSNELVFVITLLIVKFYLVAANLLDIFVDFLG